MTTFSITDIDVCTIPLTRHTHAFSVLEQHIDWFCDTYPLLSVFRDTMSWTITEGEETQVYLQTRMEGFDTIEVSNSLNDHVFYLPKMKTYVQLHELFTLLLPVDAIDFMVRYMNIQWKIQSYEKEIHPACHRIHLSITEKDFYIAVELDAMTP
jgi:hypothetical protein